MAFTLSRNAKLYAIALSTDYGGISEDDATYVDNVIANMTSLNTWQIPILEGFSFSQNTTTQEVQISEAGQTPDRGQRVYNTALEPVNWSFSNYMRPRWDSVNDGGVGDATERLLWEALAAPYNDSGASPNLVDTITNGHATERRAGADDDLWIDFDKSNTNQLLKITLLFDMDNVWYMIKDAVVDQVEMDFSIDSIATLTWTGFSKSIVRVEDSANLADLAALKGVTWGDSAWAAAQTYLKAPDTTACIRNKLTTVTLFDMYRDNTGGGSTDEYFLAITGGSLTISNNISYLTPESLGVLNKPCDHFTGARTVNGNVTAYLKDGTKETAELMGDLQANIDSADPQNFNMHLFIGGASTDTPIIDVHLPHAHLVVPVINVEDVVSIDMGINGLPYDEGASPATWDLSKTNEVTVAYKPQQ